MSYPGGKGASGVAQAIINEQPPHRVYIEPFLGGGSVLKAKRPAQIEIALDLDSAVTGNFSDAARPGLTVLNTDALIWLREYKPTADTLIYADPPYPLASRMRARRLYKYEMTDHDHRRLLTALLQLPCMVQLSTYPNEMYARMLSDWRLVSFQGWSRGGPMEEHLYMNYPPPRALHDYSYLGANYRERERIQRKTARWSARIGRLPELERLALFSAMASTIDGSNSEEPLRAAPTSPTSEAAGPAEPRRQAPPLPPMMASPCPHGRYHQTRR
jgi:hypothetical protein